MTDHTPNSKVPRLEVVSTGARRRWTLEEKQRIVAESYGGPRLVSVTARRKGLSASQLFTWRRLAREDRLSGDAMPALVPVEIAKDHRVRSGKVGGKRIGGRRHADKSIIFAAKNRGRFPS